MVDQIAQYDLPFDYIKRREEVVKGMTIDGHRKLAEKYIVPDRMIYLVVGDAKTQLERLGRLGMGDPTLLDREGNRVSGRE